MARKEHLEAIDRSFRDICECAEPFGGKVMMLSGDFRQILPVIQHASPREVINAVINRSYLWKYVVTFHLRINERVNKLKEQLKINILKYIRTNRKWNISYCS